MWIDKRPIDRPTEEMTANPGQVSNKGTLASKIQLYVPHGAFWVTLLWCLSSTVIHPRLSTILEEISISTGSKGSPSDRTHPFIHNPGPAHPAMSHPTLFSRVSKLLVTPFDSVDCKEIPGRSHFVVCSACSSTPISSSPERERYRGKQRVADLRDGGIDECNEWTSDEQQRRVLWQQNFVPW